MPEDLEAQIERERKELESAPKIPIAQFQPKETGTTGRCGWCGQVSDHLVEAERITVGNQAIIRYKGRDCCGGRHI